MVKKKTKKFIKSLIIGAIAGAIVFPSIVFLSFGLGGTTIPLENIEFYMNTALAGGVAGAGIATILLWGGGI